MSALRTAVSLIYLASIADFASAQVVVASKQDSETAILAEMAAALLRVDGIDVRVSHSMGGTPVVWHALVRGDVDVYPEYTGTITQQVLRDPSLTDFEKLRSELASRGIGLTPPLGFANNYAIGMTQARADALKIRAISDLKSHPKLRLGFSSEFLGRDDGWPGLKRHYQLPQTDVRGMDHQLAYLGLAAGDIDATDLYTTDAEIHTRSLVALIDDRKFFPRYEAVFAYRLTGDPRIPRALGKLVGQLNEATMIGLNERAKSRIDPARIASDFLKTAAPTETWVDRLWVHTIEHIAMVSGAVAVSILVGVPLGILAARRPKLGAVVLAATGIVQTIPSMALLVLLIPIPLIGGTGTKPALVALSLYGLLPVVRNTLTGLREIPPNLREAAAGLGLPPRAILWLVELPMASRSILAGIKTSAVISVGTATLGALIGAGGYGQEIMRGIQLTDMNRVLEGAIPAAVMALVVEGLFTLLERVVVPRGLRLSVL